MSLVPARPACALLAALLIGQLATACRHRTPATPSYRPPTVCSFERRLGEALETEEVDGVPLGEYLATLDVRGCLEMEEQDLVEALGALRRLHRVTYERASGPGRLLVWDMWRRHLAHFSDDGASLVSTFLDHPDLGRSYFFCDDDLPTAWRSLEAGDFRQRARAYFDAEVEARWDTLTAGGADSAGAVEALDDLRSRIVRRFEAQFGADQAGQLEGLQADLDAVWLDKVDAHDLGRPVLYVRKPPPPDPREVLQAGEPGEPATYSDHAQAANRGAVKYTEGWVPPGGAVLARIPDPDDVARKSRTVRSWKRTRREIVRLARVSERRASDLEEALAGASDEERDALIRELNRAALELDHLHADMNRHRHHVEGFTSGTAGADALLRRARTREFRRIHRGRGKLEDAQDSVQAVAERVEEAMPVSDATGREGDGPVASDGTRTDGVDPTVSPGIDRPGEPDPVEADDGRTLVYEGPCPAPDPEWSAALVAALLERYPFLDETDARIFLSLLLRTHGGLGGRSGVEAAVEEHLRQGVDLRLRAGRAGELSEHHDPQVADDAQEVITFYVWLGI